MFLLIVGLDIFPTNCDEQTVEVYRGLSL